MLESEVWSSGQMKLQPFQRQVLVERVWSTFGEEVGTVAEALKGWILIFRDAMTCSGEMERRMNLGK